MKLLEDRIRKDGVVIGEDILKVDSFLNHQIDVALLREMGREWKRLYEGTEITKILTIEASGIGIACAAAEEFGCPVLFAKKSRTRNLTGDVYSAKVHSFTHNTDNDVQVSKKYLNPEDKVLVIDDFLANGEALRGLIDLVRQAGATLVGCGVAIEKAFEPGGADIRSRGIRVESLARVRSMSETDGIVFEEN